MPNATEEMILKAIETAGFASGGALNPEQQARFVQIVKQFSRILPEARFVRMPQATVDVDKAWLNEPITEPIAENTDTPNLATPKFNRIRLQAQKLRSSWQVTTESLQQNIEGDDFEDVLMNMMTRRFSTDIELLGIQGDTTIVPSDPTTTLLSAADGWDVITDDSHILNADGRSVQKGLFAEMINTMPKQYLQDPDLAWILSESVWTDWMDLQSDRATAVGDAALQGRVVGPFGKRVIVVPLIPDNLAVAITDATPAQVTGGEVGPFVLTTANNVLVINVDGAGAITVTLPTGTLETTVVAAAINAADPSLAGVASDNREGQLLLTSPTTGAASTIVIAATSTALGVLGLTAGTTTGVAAAGGGTVAEGSFIWLTNPRNLIWGLLDGVRVYSSFNQKFDRIETDMFAQVAYNVENIDACVKAVNVRLRTLF